MINADASPGSLEIRNGSGDWVSVDPPKGALVVNVGDMLEALSGGVFRSTPHRVSNRNITSSGEGGRRGRIRSVQDILSVGRFKSRIFYV